MVRSTKISLQEAAERLDVHYMTAYRYVRTGRLPAERDGGRWVVDTRDVERLQRAVPRRRGAGVEAARARLQDRMVAADEAGAWAVVEEALTSAMDPPQVHLELLGPVLESIGLEWAEGRLTVGDEHRASGVATRLIGRLGPRFNRRGRKRGVVVLGAPRGERHALPSAMLADLLRAAGFDVVDLGADTPAESFAEAARSHDRLAAVLIGVTTDGLDEVVPATIAALRSAGLEAPVLVGGAAIGSEERARALGADGWSGRSGREAVAAVEGLTPAGGRRRGPAP